ncbi:MAG TPA: ATP-binding protein [Stellaceae bacterium]|nr:ATP-binding protein [Stellaceae bacterium]
MSRVPLLTRSALVIGLVPCVFLLGLAIYLVYGEDPILQHGQALVTGDYETVTAARAVLATMQDAEADQRGFVITGDTRYLNQFSAAEKQVPEQLARLRQRISLPKERAALDDLDQALRTEFDQMRLIMDSRRTSGFAAAAALFDHPGETVMARIQASTGQLVAKAGERVKAGLGALAAAERRARIPTLLGSVLSIVAIATAALLTMFAIRRSERAEASRARQAALLQATLDSVREGVGAFDASGELVAVNQRFLTIGSFPEAIGTLKTPLASITTVEGTPHAVFADLPAIEADSRRAGGPVLVERRSTDGRIIEIYVNPTPGGGFVTTSIDVSQQRQAETIARQSAKMDTLGQLTGGIAHDFNNLLTVVMGNLSMLESRSDLDAAARARIAAALAGAERGAKLISQLLAFARRQPLEPRSIDLGELLTEIDEILGRTLGGTIELKTIRADGLWQTLVDPNQIANAILNMALNARDAMPDGGKLTVDVSNATLDDAYVERNADVKAGPYVLLTVTDTGTGIPADILDHVFEPFFTTKRDGEGSGLGLSQVFGFVKQSNGHIKIVSTPGHGTAVKLYLPRAEIPPAQPA